MPFGVRGLSPKCIHLYSVFSGARNTIVILKLHCLFFEVKVFRRTGLSTWNFISYGESHKSIGNGRKPSTIWGVLHDTRRSFSYLSGFRRELGGPKEPTESSATHGSSACRLRADKLAPEEDYTLYWGIYWAIIISSRGLLSISDGLMVRSGLMKIRSKI